MRPKINTHSTSFSMPGEMYAAIKTVSHELGIDASELIRQAIEDYLQKKSFNPGEKECSQKDQENPEGEDGLLQ